MSRRKPRREIRDWTHEPFAPELYCVAKASAQQQANETGFDVGLERNDIFKTFRTFLLPRRENRRGHELACEVVSCEDLAKCWPGHGPNTGPLTGPNLTRPMPR